MLCTIIKITDKLNQTQNEYIFIIKIAFIENTVSVTGHIIKLRLDFPSLSDYIKPQSQLAARVW